jgi:hypothetical protein
MAGLRFELSFTLFSIGLSARGIEGRRGIFTPNAG